MLRQIRDKSLTQRHLSAAASIALGLVMHGLSAPAAHPEPTPSTRDEYELSPSAFRQWRPDADSFDAPTFREALKAYGAGRIEAGDALAARQRDPAARAALEWAAIRNAKATLGFTRLTAFLEANPGFPMTDWIRRRAEAALFDEHRPSSSARLFFKTYRPETAAGRIVLATLNRDDGNIADATTLIRQAWRDNSITPGLESAILKSFPDAISPQDLRYRAERAVFRHNLGDGLRIAQRLGEDYALLLRALNAALRETGDAAKALDAVPPAERKGASYALAKATLLRRAGKLDEAALVMRSAPRSSELIVSGEDWWVERRLLARKLLDKGDATTAYAVASGYNATTDATRIDAEFHAGWIALRFLNDAEAAEVHFSRAATFAKTPLSLSRTAYWLGRAREALGRHSGPAYLAAARFSATFYGQLAADRLGQATLALRGDRPNVEARRAFEAGTSARTIRLLIENDARELALPLALDYVQTSKDAETTAALLELLAGYRDANLLLTVGKAASQNGLPADRYAFPLFGIPPFTPVNGSAERALVFAIARQESAFNPTAVSHAGARGLMQMMPATASATARQFQLPYALEQLTREPSANARLGAAHLGHLLQSLRGSYILVFGGYNAGTGRIKEWMAAYGDPRDADADIIDWIERIPITETRNYVQRVMENFQVYRALLSDDRTLQLRSDLARGARASDDVTTTGAIPRPARLGLAGR